ncbi:MAG: hypothetical protein C5B52_07325 [Bacteroidetes bacterium]|nr:MAG: hypothetical protein C5B52_07325 [Bacteroidota bacterium]
MVIRCRVTIFFMRKAVGIFTLLLFCFTLSRSGKSDTAASLIARGYHYADSLYNLDNPNDNTDAAARLAFANVISIYSDSSRIPDTILFNSYWKKGVLAEMIGKFDSAKVFYNQALHVSGKIPAFTDSLNFRPLLYLGALYYRENEFDSTRKVLERAEALADKYSLTQEVERLYNTLGALFFEGGNFLQSKNYLEKALQVIDKKSSEQTVEKINFKLNIATALSKLERYDEALDSYLALLKTGSFKDTICFNIGNIYMELGQYDNALKYFYYSSNINHSAGLLNEIADAHLMLRNFDSASYYLNLSEQKINSETGGSDKKFTGIYHLYKGDYFLQTQDPMSAVKEYQNSIVALENDFSDTSIYSNPTNFWGTFSTYMLFKAIVRKAVCFERIYRNTKDIKYKKAALDAYISAIELASYLEKSMDTDEARIFLKKNYNAAYHKAVDLAIELYAKTGEESMLWKAHSIVEQNKSSVLVANLQELSVKNRAGVPDSLLETERNLKYQIARLQVKADQLPDSISTKDLATEKRNAEIELSTLQKKIKQFLNPEDLQNYEQRSLTTHFDQTKLTDNQAILDFYFTDSNLHIFAITRENIMLYSLPVKELNWSEIQILQTSLYEMEDGRQKMYETVTSRLFRQIIAPVFETIKEKKEWIVLPDGAFYYLPLEILTDGSTGKMLIEDYAISYNFTSEFINKSKPVDGGGEQKLLAMAPFSRKGLGNIEDTNSLEHLPATAIEVSNLKGRIMMDSLATKNYFIWSANKYRILHLATHAVMNTEKPSQSFIAFYPTDASHPESYKLYLNELYGLNLDSTNLMLLSACETGIGKFVQGEGVMSLSRGVLYAGCPSVITTLWRADDKATAFIMQEFHKNLEQGEDLPNALRLAKLEFIHKYPSTAKNPSLWAHLILMGKTDPLYTSNFKMWLSIGLGILIATAIAALIIMKKGTKSKVRA